MVEPTGPELHITAEVAGVEIVAIIRERLKIAAGDTINLAVEYDKHFLFDAESQASIQRVAR